jgi:hypothetical protein
MKNTLKHCIFIFLNTITYITGNSTETRDNIVSKTHLFVVQSTKLLKQIRHKLSRINGPLERHGDLLSCRNQRYRQRKDCCAFCLLTYDLW